MHISIKMALRLKIDVSDDTCMYHILMFGHTAIWPNHSKTVVGLLQYVVNQWWLPVPPHDVKSVNPFCVSLTQQHNNSDWVAGTLPATFTCVSFLNSNISKEENRFIRCGHGGSKESDKHGSCLAIKWQSWDCNPGVLNLRREQPSVTQLLFIQKYILGHCIFQTSN